MDDLMGVAAQQEMRRIFQRGENQRKLGDGEVLHLVDHYEVVGRLGQRPPRLRRQVEIITPGLLQPRHVTAVKPMHICPRGAGREQRLANAERLVLVKAQGRIRPRPDDAAKLLEQREAVGIGNVAQRRAVAIEPGLEIGQPHLAPGRDLNGFQKLAVAQELDFLVSVLITMRAIEAARRLGEICRLSDIEHPARCLAQLGQGHRRLARAGRPQHHDRHRRAPDLFLDVVEHDGLVE